MFQDRIRENYDGLTPGFRRLADFLMTNTLDAAFLTATELSRRVGVDPATVVRFAQEFGLLRVPGTLTGDQTLCARSGDRNLP
jgi:DNA-binding MurR/RpiR family transcriptional regulator